MAQLLEQLLSIPEVRGSTPVIGKIYIEHFFVNLAMAKLTFRNFFIGTESVTYYLFYTLHFCFVAFINKTLFCCCAVAYLKLTKHKNVKKNVILLFAIYISNKSNILAGFESGIGCGSCVII